MQKKVKLHGNNEKEGKKRSPAFFVLVVSNIIGTQAIVYKTCLRVKTGEGLYVSFGIISFEL